MVVVRATWPSCSTRARCRASARARSPTSCWRSRGGPEDEQADPDERQQGQAGEGPAGPAEPGDPGPGLGLVELDDVVHPEQVADLQIHDDGEVVAGGGGAALPRGQAGDGVANPPEIGLDVVHRRPDGRGVLARQRERLVAEPEAVVRGGPADQDDVQLGAEPVAIVAGRRPLQRQRRLGQPLAEHPLPARHVDDRGVGGQLVERGLHQGLVHQDEQGHQRQRREVAAGQVMIVGVGLGGSGAADHRSGGLIGVAPGSVGPARGRISARGSAAAGRGRPGGWRCRPCRRPGRRRRGRPWRAP